MRVAFLMQCHKSPEQINLLLDALNHPLVDVFIHIDKKFRDIRSKIVRRENVFFLSEKECIDVQWGQFSQVEATLKMMRNISRGVCIYLADQWTRLSAASN